MDTRFHGIVWTGSTLLDIRNPDPSKIHLKDVARGLSRTYRYAGHTHEETQPYSTAWHSLFCEMVADQMGLPLWVRLQALLHDAPEYILGDMMKPIKVLIPQFEAIESGLWGATATRFQIPKEFHPAVKKIDQIAFDVECHCLISSPRWYPDFESGEDWKEWLPQGETWIKFTQARQPEYTLAASLFTSRTRALLDARAAEEQC